jgi:ribosome-binding factor A
MSFENKERRNLKFVSILKHTLNEILQKEISDPRIGFVTITGISISPDRKHARIYVSILGDEKQHQESFKGLISASGYIRHLLSKKLQTRFTPEIEFVEDINPGLKVEEILKEIEHEKERNQ